MGAVELRGAGEREIVWLGLRGEQDPDGVDAEGGAEGNVQELEEAEHQGWSARPGLVLQQAPSAGEAGGGLDEKKHSQGGEETLQEIVREENIFAGHETAEERGAENEQHGCSDQLQHRGRNPKDAADINVARRAAGLRRDEGHAGGVAAGRATALTGPQVRSATVAA